MCFLQIKHSVFTMHNYKYIFNLNFNKKKRKNYHIHKLIPLLNNILTYFRIFFIFFHIGNVVEVSLRNEMSL